MLPFTREPRLARCTIFRIPLQPCRFCDAGFYNRAWVREYNLVTQVRRRNSADDAVLSTA